MCLRRRIAIVGSGFAGAILARVLAGQGHRVILVDRGRHPRFALGESATPLAALSLERLAARWHLPDLDDLAAYGRWRSALPHLGHGLKRGFTFYGHDRGTAYANGARDERRLLVAASHRDSIADCHWRRADVDAHLVERARSAGVEVLEGREVAGVAETERGLVLRLRGDGAAERPIAADYVLDASGPGGALARDLPEAARARARHRTSLVASHFVGVRPFVEVATGSGARLAPGPYPEESAAVHHILEGAWLYVLPFDDGTVSAGLVTRGAGPPPDGELPDLLSDYPTLAACFATARRTGPDLRVAQIAYRSRHAVGTRWALLPSTYAFDDPLFSTGIAWSLVGVERLGQWGAALATGDGDGAARLLRRYGALAEREADHLGALVDLAWAAMPDFDGFAATVLLYFAAASFCEARQRLSDGIDCWEGFLGSTHPGITSWPERAAEGGGSLAGILELIGPQNVAGLGDPIFGRRIPASIDHLVAAAPKLDLDAETLRRRLTRLRGFDR